MKKKNVNSQGKLALRKKRIAPLTSGSLEWLQGGQQLPTGPHGCTVGTSVTCPPTMWPPTYPAPATHTCRPPVTQ